MKKLIIVGLSSLTLLFGSNSAITSSIILENNASAYDVEKLELNMQHLLAFKKIDDTTLEITNWVLRDLHNVVIVVKRGELQEKILEIDTLKGFTKTTFKVPFIGEDTTFDFIPQTPTQERIKGIKTTWNIKFPDRLMLGERVRKKGAKVVWKPTRPQDVRYYLTFLINASQTISHPKFHEFWLKTAFYDKRCKIEPKYRLTQEELENYSEKEQLQYDDITTECYYNKEHKEFMYNKFLHKNFNVGVTGGGGLGGGATLGLNQLRVVENMWKTNDFAVKSVENGDWFIPKKNRKIIGGTPWKIFGHEAGHTLGAGHKQNYCVYSLNSSISVGTLIHYYLTTKDEMIITKDTMVGRDIDWEGANLRLKRKYKRAISRGVEESVIEELAKKLHRPTWNFAYEWGGYYEKHAILLPTKNTKEWYEYLKAHKEGRGLEYLKSLQQ